VTRPSLTYAERLAFFQRQQRYRKHQQFGTPWPPKTGKPTATFPAAQPPTPPQSDPAPGNPPSSQLPTTRLPAQAPEKKVVRLRVRVTAGPDVGRQFGFPEGEFVVGRAPDADLPLTDDAVSHHHAKIVVTSQRATLEDLGSLNGTTLDSVKLRGRAILGPGHRATMAETELTFEAGDRHA
jgi:pSer/pThr/pTyr-binding forkhead associated (FHA) protein